MRNRYSISRKSTLHIRIYIHTYVYDVVTYIRTYLQTYIRMYVCMYVLQRHEFTGTTVLASSEQR